jgi:hypothetical protein
VTQLVLAGGNQPYLQACLQAGEVFTPPSVSVIVFAVTLSLAGPTSNDDDELASSSSSQPMCWGYGDVP